MTTHDLQMSRYSEPYRESGAKTVTSFDLEMADYLEPYRPSQSPRLPIQKLDKAAIRMQLQDVRKAIGELKAVMLPKSFLST